MKMKEKIEQMLTWEYKKKPYKIGPMKIDIKLIIPQ